MAKQSKKQNDNEKPPFLGIYCRTSTDRKDKGAPSIARQKNLGIQFAISKKIKYEIYEDEGKSGYKISEDEFDPMNNRPGFSRLVDDIKSKKINRVWVWEHSRLSRNNYASAFIFNIFEKFNIILYEDDKEFNLNDPNFKLQRQVLDAISEYERHLIVNRMASGKEKKVNEGYRTYPFLYGYKKAGRNSAGLVAWEPVEAEIEIYNIAVQKYMEGMTLRRICTFLYETKHIDRSGYQVPQGWMGRLLRKYQYTGYQLTTEGMKIWQSFLKLKFDDLSILKDRKFWVKSVHFREELISIDDWVELSNRLQKRRKHVSKTRKDRVLSARAAIATGLIECGECGKRYYYKQSDMPIKSEPSGIRRYHTYYHLVKYNIRDCWQKPHSFRHEMIDEIYKLFYFYFYLVFDNTLELSNNTQQRLKLERAVTKEKIDALRKEIRKLENQIPKLKEAMETEQNIKTIQTIAATISEIETKLDEGTEKITMLEIDFQVLQGKLDKEIIETTYYDVKEKIQAWFKKLDTEQKRNELLKVIKKSVIFNHHLLIDTGAIIFLFNINRHYKFDEKLLSKLDKDEIYKLHFIDGTYGTEVRKHERNEILNIDLEKTENTRIVVSNYLKEKQSIMYDLKDATNLIDFTFWRGLYNIERSKV
jgi:DNA invertase Pin-like site-specific DNA recombinase